MDPILTGILTRVLAGALTATIVQLSKKAFVSADRSAHLSKWTERFREGHGEIQKAVATAIDTIALGEKYVGIDSVEEYKEFLSKPEVVELVNQIYAAHICSSPLSFEALEQEMSHLLRLQFRYDEAHARSVAAPLFRLLWKATDDALTASIERGELSPIFGDGLKDQAAAWA